MAASRIPVDNYVQNPVFDDTGAGIEEL